jgi:IstB-like ATP binding protein
VITAKAAAARDVTAEIVFLTRALKAPTLRDAVPRLAGRARTESWTHEEFLAACLQREVSARESHGGEGRIRAARFPARKALEDFDYDHQRSLKREVIAHLGTLDFVAGIGNHRYQNPPNTQPASWWEQGTRTLAGDRAALWPARPARSGFPA